MHVALLRGINVGKAKRIAMADLRMMCTGMGYGDVTTLLNSGNIVFSAPRADSKAAAKLEQRILADLGVASRVIVLTATELAAIMDENPLSEQLEHPSRFLVTVLAPDADRSRLEPLARQSWPGERVALGSRALYSWCGNGILESKAQLALGKALGDRGTSRNWATMTKLLALATESSQ